MTMTATDMAEIYERDTAVADLDAAGGSASAVSWSAIIAGAFAAAALSLILMTLGAGLGLSTVSPWSGSWASVKAVGAATAIWFVVSQWLSAGLGGYLAGRLRTKWTGIHSDEVLFRDTAHGFLAWAVAAVVSVALLSSALTALGIGGASLASGRSQGAGQTASVASEPTDYYVDVLFRSSNGTAQADDQAVRGQAARILASGVGNGELAAADRTYLAQLVAGRTGLSQGDAEKRVDDVFARQKAAISDAADKVRKAGAYLAFATCLSMLVGAFIASVAAAIGGRQRDADHLAPAS